MLLIYILLVLFNFGLSWLNAYQVGRVWADSKVAGSWPRTVVWAGAVMAAVGFTWCYLVVLVLIANAFEWLPPEYLQLAFNIGYVIIIVPAIGSGMIIWVHSVLVAWKERTISAYGVAAYNTFANMYNVYQAATMLPGIFQQIAGHTASDGGSSSSGVSGGISKDTIVVLLVLLALGGGIVTTWLIVRSSVRQAAWVNGMTLDAQRSE